jgi:RsiW-degrading membrane proteinase PrsW (M82 family)
VVTVPANEVAVGAGDSPYDLAEPAVSKPAVVSRPAPMRAPAAATAGSARLEPVALGTAALHPALSMPSLKPRGLHSWSYVLLILALIPLVMSTFHKSEETEARLKQSFAAHPEAIERLEEIKNAKGAGMTDDDVLSALPDDRLDGAMLARESHMHWAIALGAGVAYFGFLLAAFPRASRYVKGLLFAGIFTGTAGVLLLLFFQFVAIHMPLFVPRSILGLVLLVISLIGWSYSLAMGDTGFVLSFVGFTFGVGLCEEITKAIPMLIRIRSTPGEEEASWNSMLLWGLASGMGFGIAEGIMYSGQYYNGVQGTEMYVVRFVSCVVLHAMWSGAVGVTLYRRQGWLHDAGNNWEYFFRLILIVIVPMVLHGLYDTLLKKEMDALALVVAVVSFGWLAYQIERQWRTERVLGVTE